MPRKKTHEEYVKELAEKNPNILVLGKYINSKTAILHKCLKDGYEWESSPGSIINNGTGCPMCAGNIKKTNKQYVAELSLKNPNVEPLEKYISAKVPILHRCKIHGIEWEIAPTDALNGHGCLQCKVEKSGAGKNKKTNEQYITELNNINPNIVALETYIDMKTPILHKCLIDNFEWKAFPSNTLRGSRCPECNRRERSKTQSKSHDQYVKEVKLINPNIQVIGRYINAKTPILHKCSIDGFEWTPTPSSVLSGFGCPVCGIKKNSENRKRSQKQYINDVYLVNPNIEVVGKYTSIFEPIEHRCKIHNIIYNTTPNNVLYRAGGCPLCNESNGERKIRLWLERNNITYETQKRFEDCCDIKPLPFDFYLPKYNISIEFDGKQHFKPIEYFGGEKTFKIQKKHDKIKDDFCKENGISLLRIPYYKLKNIEEELNNFIFI